MYPRSEYYWLGYKHKFQNGYDSVQALGLIQIHGMMYYMNLFP